jgi:antitoxin YefM
MIWVRIQSLETTYTNLRRYLASILDRAAHDRTVIIVRRYVGVKVAIVPTDELTGWIETAYLLRSPKNARRLLKALQRTRDQNP